MSKSAKKTLTKSVKYLQAEIIHRKMSGGNSMGRNFQRSSYCPEGNYLRVTVRGFGGTCLRGNFSRVIVRGAKNRWVIVLGGISEEAIARVAVVQGEII